MKKKGIIFTSIFLSLIIAVCSFTPIVNMSENISEKVFRLHILANSDEKYDQELKLKVRDEVLKHTEIIFSHCSSVKEAINSANSNMSEIAKTAQRVIYDNGYNYPVKAYTTNEYFNTRKYENFTLPAGVYSALKIEIGCGRGKNWWCVMFPAVCITGCSDEFNKSLTEEERKMIESDKYIIKFKAVEIYENIKNRLQKLDKNP